MASSKQMTSRERVHAALNFQKPDRVPIDLGGFQTGIHKKAYIELLKYLERDETSFMTGLFQSRRERQLIAV